MPQAGGIQARSAAGRSSPPKLPVELRADEKVEGAAAFVERRCPEGDEVARAPEGDRKRGKCEEEQRHTSPLARRPGRRDESGGEREQGQVAEAGHGEEAESARCRDEPRSPARSHGGGESDRGHERQGRRERLGGDRA